MMPQLCIKPLASGSGLVTFTNSSSLKPSDVIFDLLSSSTNEATNRKSTPSQTPVGQ